MDEARLRQLLGEWMPTDRRDVADIVASANADEHEGAEWLPRYKAALSLLAQMAGVLTGTLIPLETALAGQPAAATIAARMKEADRLWQAHLRLVGDWPAALNIPTE